MTAGSRIDIADLVGAEGSFVKFGSAGCVILGKTKTVEFAYGAAGTNSVRGTPWTPGIRKSIAHPVAPAAVPL